MALDDDGPGHSQSQSQDHSAVPVHPQSLISLPEDVLFLICRYCDISTLGRLAQVCRRFSDVFGKNCVWRQRLLRVPAVTLPKGDSRTEARLSDKERYRLARNWLKADVRESRVKVFPKKLMPWLQRCGSQLWVSYFSHLQCYLHGNFILQSLSTHSDISRFKIQGRRAVTAHCDGSVTVTSLSYTNTSYVYPRCHVADIHDIDCVNDVVVTGSKDRTAKIWRFPPPQPIESIDDEDEVVQYDVTDTVSVCRSVIEINDRVWSVAINPDQRSVLVGSAGISQSQPLNIFDIERGTKLCALGREFRRGAGVLGIHYESSASVLTCGYDTSLRLWDLRQPPDKCAQKWLDPYDSTLYCVRSDGLYSIFTGSANNGVIRWWDKRMSRFVQLYYMGEVFGKRSTPVYSLEFDSTRLFAALDLGVCYKDFSR